MKNIMYISYHNSNPIYDACAKQLEASLEKEGVTDFHIERFANDTWDFHTATGHKPWFIWGCMMMFQDYDYLVYLDADSVMMRYPDLFEEIPDDFDVGVHYREGTELISGVIYLKNNTKTMELVMAWAEQCQDNPRIWDQRTLQKILEERHDIKIYQLPPTYCQIFDTMAGHGGPPVIKQMQASRLSRGIDMNHNPICTH